MTQGEAACFWNCFILKLKLIFSSETSVPIYHFTQRNIPKPWTFMNKDVRK